MDINFFMNLCSGLLRLHMSLTSDQIEGRLFGTYSSKRKAHLVEQKNAWKMGGLTQTKRDNF